MRPKIRPAAFDPDPALVPSVHRLTSWLLAAEPGSRIIYYRGGSLATERADPEVEAVAKFAAALANQGVVSLVQKRLAAEEYLYEMQRRAT